MENFPKKLQDKLQRRRENNALRSLGTDQNLIDFSSNDYLGFSKSDTIFQRTLEMLDSRNVRQNGSTGSRLLSGNSRLHEETEAFLAEFHHTESALLFNSGYDANLGFFASVPQRGDLVFYDELIHASIRDGLRQSLAKSYKFKHNDISSIQLPPKEKGISRSVYVVTESVFSMDGDSPDLKAFADFCTENKCHLIVDEAHAVGIFGKNRPDGETGGQGLVQELGIEQQVFARINTFGKALGCHGAVVLGSATLQEYLINFARSFIYTTALAPHAVATIRAAYAELEVAKSSQKLCKNIAFFKTAVKKYHLQSYFIPSRSAIHSCGIPGNEMVKTVAQLLQKEGFDVKPILSPTVPVGKERLRFCLHSYNSQKEISEVLDSLATFVIGMR